MFSWATSEEILPVTIYQARGRLTDFGAAGLTRRRSRRLRRVRRRRGKNHQAPTPNNAQINPWFDHLPIACRPAIFPSPRQLATCGLALMARCLHASVKASSTPQAPP